MPVPEVGDWLRTPSPGVWQAYRVLAGFNEFRYSPASRKEPSDRVLVFSKRLVDAAWKPGRPRAEVCEASLVKPLGTADRRKVDAFLTADPGRRAAFEASVPGPVDLVVNLTMAVPRPAVLRSFVAATLANELPGGVPLDRVLALLDGAGLGGCVGRMPTNATLQLICRDHEVRGREFVLRDCAVLPF